MVSVLTTIDNNTNRFPKAHPKHLTSFMTKSQEKLSKATHSKRSKTAASPKNCSPF